MRKAPKGSTAKVAYHLKQLRKLFARSNDAAFLQMIWAVDALRSDRAEPASTFLSFPSQAATSDSSPFAIHRWELETLLIQLLLTPKQEIKPGPNLILNCKKFESIREAINRLRKLEDVESAVYLESTTFSVLDEMHRIAQRQFHWQHGYLNLPQFYRYAFVYGQGNCADYFEQRYGIKTTDLTLLGFIYFAVYQQTPWLQLTAALGLTVTDKLGLTQQIIDKARPLLTISLDQARTETSNITQQVNHKHGKSVPIAYLPSIFRRFPLLFHDQRRELFIAPAPEMILMRVTSGLYYDLISGGQGLLNDANDRFEQYCTNYIATMMPRFRVERSFRYGPKGLQTDSPDVLVKDNGKVVLAVECKATKLTYLAQFAEDPFESERKQYQQIARGIFQLWRYFSHIRRGALQLELAPDTHAMVLTLDPFAMMASELRDKIMDEAKRFADEEGNIIDEDRRQIIICPIQELEQVLHRANECTFLTSLKASQDEKYSGWQFREIHRDTEGAKSFGKSREFPFDLGILLPWWNEMQTLAKTRASTV